MLRWRLLLGFLIILTVVGLCWADHLAPIPGLVLFPLLIFGVWMATGEILYLAESGKIRPVGWVVYAGNLLLVGSAWIPPLYFRFQGDTPHVAGHYAASYPTATGGWVLLAFSISIILVFLAEMRRYERPGGVMVNVAVAVFALSYIGLLLTFLVQLRMSWGIGGLASMLIVTKLGDTGAYAVGRLIGRNKMAPGLSPAKTIEGAVGAIVFAVVGSWAVFRWLVPAVNPEVALSGTWWGWAIFGVAVCLAGMAGDLAESLLKRDVKRKDSSSWVPGFGGVLDILDSMLFAAPVAYACWAFGLVG